MFDRAYLEITDVCNLSCAFCPGTARPPQFITLPAFSRLAEKLRPCTGYLYLHVLGEPLSHHQLHAADGKTAGAAEQPRAP